MKMGKSTPFRAKNQSLKEDLLPSLGFQNNVNYYF
jgi:hypothetical protein